MGVYIRYGRVHGKYDGKVTVEVYDSFRSFDVQCSTSNYDNLEIGDTVKVTEYTRSPVTPGGRYQTFFSFEAADVQQCDICHAYFSASTQQCQCLTNPEECSRIKFEGTYRIVEVRDNDWNSKKAMQLVLKSIYSSSKVTEDYIGGLITNTMFSETGIYKTVQSEMEGGIDDVYFDIIAWEAEDEYICREHCRTEWEMEHLGHFGLEPIDLISFKRRV